MDTNDGLINDIKKKLPDDTNASSPPRRSRKKCTCTLCLFIMGTMITISAVVSYFFSIQIMNSQIHQNIVLKPDSKAYQFWTNPPARILRQYFIFDIRNPIEVQAGTAKPILVQRGPYTYSEKWEKKNVDFMGDAFVSFSPVVSLFFEPSLSVGNESDLVTFLNVPAVGMIEQTVKGKSKIIQPDAVNTILKMFKTKLFETKTVGQLIRGYKDPLMAMAKLLMPNVIKDDKFSLLNGKNGTVWQNLTIMTGNDLASNVAKIVTWDGLEKLDYWGNEYANRINGTDGTYYAPHRTRDQVIYAYNPDMCRSYNLVYLRDNKVLGIDVLDFHLPKNMFANSTLNPDNEGFCKGPCLGNGVLNISSCYGGVSGFVSQPHFLNADSKFVDDFEGLNPNENEHDFVLHFEPVTGVPITGDIRLQISFYLTQSNKIDLVKKVKPRLYPMFWFNETYIIDADTRSQLANVALYVNLATYVPIAVFVLGVVFTAFYPINLIRRKYSRKCIDNTNTNQTNSFDENASLISNKI